MSLHDRLLAEVDRREAAATAASPGPWGYNSYLAHGRHQADAQFIEMHDPIDATHRYAHYRRILTRHRTVEADTGSYWCDYCELHFMVPHCPEVADLAEALGIQPLEEEPGEAVDDTRTIG